MIRLPRLGEKRTRAIRIPASKPQIPAVTDPVNLDDVRRAADVGDKAVARILLSDNRFKASCSRGCSACCYEPVYVDFREAALVADVIRGMPVEDQVEIKGRIREWTDRFRNSSLSEQERPEVAAYRSSRIACPLLDTNTGDCRIYADRPINCRTHIALGPREWCGDDAKRIDQMYVANIEYFPSVFSALLGNRSGSLVMDHLCVLLSEILLGEAVASRARSVGLIEIVEE